MLHIFSETKERRHLEEMTTLLLTAALWLEERKIYLAYKIATKPKKLETKGSMCILSGSPLDKSLQQPIWLPSVDNQNNVLYSRKAEKEQGTGQNSKKWEAEGPKSTKQEEAMRHLCQTWNFDNDVPEKVSPTQKKLGAITMTGFWFSVPWSLLPHRPRSAPQKKPICPVDDPHHSRRCRGELRTYPGDLSLRYYGKSSNGEMARFSLRGVFCATHWSIFELVSSNACGASSELLTRKTERGKKRTHEKTFQIFTFPPKKKLHFANF